MRELMTGGIKTTRPSERQRFEDSGGGLPACLTGWTGCLAWGSGSLIGP